MHIIFRFFTIFTFSMGLIVIPAFAEKWLGQGIICKNYEDTFSMAFMSNLASSDWEAMEVYMNYISSGKCILHKKCEKVIYVGRGSKEFFDKLRKEGNNEYVKTAKIIPISEIQLSKSRMTYFVQDDYLVSSKSNCQ